MRRLYLFIVLVLAAQTAFSQLQVKEGSFKKVDGFVNINIEKMYDDNDKPYAVLKIKTENINDKQRHELGFGGDAQTFFEVEHKDGEVWLYISYYATFLKISHPDLSSTEFWFPYDMEPKQGYELTIINKPMVDEDFAKRLDNIEKIINSANDNKDYGYIIINTAPVDGATVFIDGKEMKMKTPFVSDRLPHGLHRIQIVKNLYKTQVDVISLEDSKRVLNYELKPNRAELIISTADNAEIWIDGEKKGLGSWNGYVSADIHTIEARKTGFRTKTQIITLDAYEIKTLSFQPLEQIYGILEIKTQPKGTKYIITKDGDDDNKEKGKTPKFTAQQPIGNYSIIINKKGYYPNSRSFTINDSEKTTLYIELEKKIYPKSIRAKGWVFRPEISLGGFVFADYDEYSYYYPSYYDYSYKFTFYIQETNGFAYNTNANLGYQFNPYVYLGLGCGINGYYNNNHNNTNNISAPLYLNPRFYILNKKISFYFDLKLGYSFNISSSPVDYYTHVHDTYWNNKSYTTIIKNKNMAQGAMSSIEFGIEYKHSSFGFVISSCRVSHEITIENNYYINNTYISNIEECSRNYVGSSYMFRYGYSIYNINLFKFLKK